MCNRFKAATGKNGKNGTKNRHYKRVLETMNAHTMNELARNGCRLLLVFEFVLDEETQHIVNAFVGHSSANGVNVVCVGNIALSTYPCNAVAFIVESDDEGPSARKMLSKIFELHHGRVNTKWLDEIDSNSRYWNGLPTEFKDSAFQSFSIKNCNRKHSNTRAVSR
mmetsp:Transcript_14446/g.31066  ORF Transcript_14446/g.31066 Transcript_14446/m.31066 type:complete len:166 (-) Transcript_14446:26-523(-)